MGGTGGTPTHDGLRTCTKRPPQRKAGNIHKQRVAYVGRIPAIVRGLSGFEHVRTVLYCDHALEANFGYDRSLYSCVDVHICGCLCASMCVHATCNNSMHACRKEKGRVSSVSHMRYAVCVMRTGQRSTYRKTYMQHENMRTLTCVTTCACAITDLHSRCMETTSFPYREANFRVPPREEVPEHRLGFGYVHIKYAQAILSVGVRYVPAKF